MRYLQENNETKPFIIAFLLRKKTIMFGTTLGIMALVVTNIWLAATLSHLGISLKELDQKANELAQKEMQYKQEMYAHGSLHDLEEKAKKLGFTTEVSYQQLDSDQSVALGY